MTRPYDALIVGSGFTGSLLSMGLHHQGFEVCVVEAGRHPRFAIGESSTPAADLVLRDMANRPGMEWLGPLSRYGSWRATYPGVTCGLKRGFTYFFHTPDALFGEGSPGDRTLMVAASASDERSDTHWYRPEVDAFLVERLREAGIVYYDRTRVTRCERDRDGGWRVSLTPSAGAGRRPRQLRTRFIFDATGSGAFASGAFGASETRDGFRTRTGAVFSHFDGAAGWVERLRGESVPTGGHPLDADRSALHHLVEEGWVWMLRFDGGRLSAGLVVDGYGAELSALPAFDAVLSRYPSLDALFRGARLAPMPGRMITGSRLQRRLDPPHGAGWLAVGGAAGFVDPLHSTGIAQSLLSVERILEVAAGGGIAGVDQEAGRLARVAREELMLIDHLVAAALHARSNVALFHACIAAYFALVTRWEQRRLAGDPPSHFLLAGSPRVQAMARRLADRMARWRFENQGGAGTAEVAGAIDALVDEIRDGIAPWNDLGLLDPIHAGMYRQTAVEL